MGEGRYPGGGAKVKGRQWLRCLLAICFVKLRMVLCTGMHMLWGVESGTDLKSPKYKKINVNPYVIPKKNNIISKTYIQMTST